MYDLDPNAARKADTGGSAIKELGKYIGQFTQAKDIKTKKGGKGIEFIFVSTGGQKANLAIYTVGANGDRYQGYEALMAIMTCMQVKSIKPQSATVTRYDYETKMEVKEAGNVFAELHKPIGVLLETEDYEKQDGGIGTRLVLKNVFQATTELTATEILDRKTTPQQLAKMVAGLRHRPLKGVKAQPKQEDPYSDDLHEGGAFDPDVPF